MKYLMSMITLLIGISFASTIPAIATESESTSTVYTKPSIVSKPIYPYQDYPKGINAWLKEYPELARTIIDRQQSDKAEKYESNNKSFIHETFLDLYKHIIITENEKDIFANSDDGYMGDGEISVVKIFNYRCDNFCPDEVTNIEEYLKEHPNKKVVLKETPYLNDENEYASKVALATKKIHGNDAYITIFKAFHRHPYSLIDKPDTLSKKAILKILTKNNFDIDAIMKSLDDPSILTQIENNRNLAFKLGLGRYHWNIFKGDPNSEEFKKHNASIGFFKPYDLNMNDYVKFIEELTQSGAELTK